MRWMIFAVLAVIAGPAPAQDWQMRDGDEVYDFAALSDRLVGRTITFYDDGQSRFFKDGRYTYTYADDGGVAYGYYRIGGDGTVCIDFINGFARCDLYVANGGRFVLLTEEGERFPIRPD